MTLETTRYLKEIEKNLASGKATEHTHRPAFQSLVQSLGWGVKAVNEPKRVACGAPDFVVHKDGLSIGYIETKDTYKSLDDVERSEQVKRYRDYFENFILTNYLELRWYVNGELRSKACLGKLDAGDKIHRDVEGQEKVLELLQNFLDREPEIVISPEALAQKMARLAHMIRDIIIEAFKRDSAGGMLDGLRKTFAKVLIPDLDKPERTSEFADMYAQTIAYGLFAARCNHPLGQKFERYNAAREIPKTNPFLRQLFEAVTGTALDKEPYVGFVDDLVQLLDRADLRQVLSHFGKRKKGEDPVIHFYETFLKGYDPRIREKRGVYYTPEPVVSYIVRSVDMILKKDFGLSEGLTDTTGVKRKITVHENGKEPQTMIREFPKVLILDPACGTGTFLYTVIDRIRDYLDSQGQAGMWSGYVKDHLLPRVFGFELLMAPYAVAHFKLGMQLAGQDMSAAQRQKWAYDFGSEERVQVFLTNTLEKLEQSYQADLWGVYEAIAEEAKSANRIKKEKPIMVVLGNPPYSGHSANRSTEKRKVQKGESYIPAGLAGWDIGEDGRAKPNYSTARSTGFRDQPTFIGALMKDYYICGGDWLGEKNPKWLQDDYVKFIRWAQWRIEETGCGVLAFITNHGYLDNPTFRGMRWQLMNTFSEIYILDLHGNVKKKERCPDGGPDQNVFDIQQGVAIGIFVKKKGHEGPARVFHSELWGSREQKGERLEAEDVTTTEWTELQPSGQHYLFVPEDTDLKKEYKQGWKITDIFPVHNVGLVTARDKLTIQWTAEDVWDVVRDFSSLSPEKARVKYNLGKDVRDWKVHLAQEDLLQSGPDKNNITQILYRPFDKRFTYYTGKSRGFICMPRPEIMRHMKAGFNRAICTTRSIEIGKGWEHVFCTRYMIQHHSVSLKEVNYVFPIYIMSSEGENREDLRINLKDKFINYLETKFDIEFTQGIQSKPKLTVSPEDIFHYIYAILHSPTYRSRYTEYLKRDFPYIPVTSDKDLFFKLAELGRELAAYHLLESPNLTLSNFVTRFPEGGDSRVEKGYPKYYPAGEVAPGEDRPLKAGRVYTNDRQYFEGVSEDIWEFMIGGYQVAEKWLKDRKGRKLSHEEIETYHKIILALSETVRLMKEIDRAIPEWPVR